MRAGAERRWCLWAGLALVRFGNKEKGSEWKGLDMNTNMDMNMNGVSLKGFADKARALAYRGEEDGGSEIVQVVIALGFAVGLGGGAHAFANAGQHGDHVCRQLGYEHVQERDERRGQQQVAAPSRLVGRSVRIDGASVVTFVMALPLLMSLLCAVVDIGRAAYLGMEADVAAQAACRDAAGRIAQGDKAPDKACALSAALGQAPGLAGEGVSCSIEIDCPPVQTKGVERKTFDPQAGRFEEQLVEFAYRQVDVEMRVNARCLTPVGDAVLGAMGQANGLRLSSTASRTVSVEADTGVQHGFR